MKRTVQLLLVCLLMVFVPSLQGRAGDGSSIPCISRSHADSLSARLVLWRGRICPLNTPATDFTRRVCGRRRPYGYTPEQVVASWALYPETWNRAPLVLVENAELRRRLGTTGRHIALVQLYEGETYRLQTLLDAASPEDAALVGAIRDVDERVRLVAELIGGNLIQPAPADCPPLPSWQLQLELWNNRFPLFQLCYALLLLASTAGFIGYIRSGNGTPAAQPKAYWKKP